MHVDARVGEDEGGDGRREERPLRRQRARLGRALRLARCFVDTSANQVGCLVSVCSPDVESEGR